jgi:hypothetical protein
VSSIQISENDVEEPFYYAVSSCRQQDSALLKVSKGDLRKYACPMVPQQVVIRTGTVESTFIQEQHLLVVLPPRPSIMYKKTITCVH